jgi:hypothetical protein
MAKERCMKFFVSLSTTLLVAAAAVTVLAQKADPSWLDTPISNWNKAGAPLPRATPKQETIAALSRRCEMPILGGTAGERALADAGWLPFHLFDRQIVQGDAEIVGGMTAADGMCRPMQFNVFVFAGEGLAGTLSPALMNSRTDGSAGVVRLAEDETIVAQFARYTEKDALCCPSGRVSVRFRIDRKSVPALVVPLEVETARP